MATSHPLARPALAPIALLHPPGDPEHSVSFALWPWMPMGYPVDARGFPVRGDASRAFDHRPPGHQWQPLFNVYARDLVGVFPQIVDQLLADSVFTLLGMYVPRRVLKARTRDTRGPAQLGEYRPSSTTVWVDGQPRLLPAAIRSNDHVRGITAAWADLDFYKVGLTEGAVVGALHDMEQREEIPPHSMLLISGRGIWVLWVLRDHEDTTRAVRAGFSNMRRWQRVQREINARLVRFGADLAAIDAAHTARVPGSLRTDLGDEPVAIGWQLQGAPGDTQAFTYTLEELERRLGIQRQLGAEAVSATLEVPLAASLHGRRGYLGRFHRLLQQLEALEAMRGRWGIGTRERAMWLQAGCMISVQRSAQRLDDSYRLPEPIQQIVRLTEEDLFEYLLAIGRRAEAGEGFFPRSAARAALRRAVKERGLGKRVFEGRPPSHQTVAGWLHVTPAESERLREQGFTGPFPPSLAFGPALDASLPMPNRAATGSARRAAIQEILEGCQRGCAPWPALRGIRSALAARGIGASLRTVREDLIELGITNPKAHSALRLARERREAGGRLPFEVA